MSKFEKKLPIGPIVILLAVVLVITAVGTLFGGKKTTEADEAVAAGIAYLEELEAKDPAEVMEVRQAIYQAEIDAKRDQILLQLNNGTLDPFSLIKDYVLLGDSRAVGFWYRNFLDRSNVLADGDSVTVVKTLKVKGASQPIKAGTTVRNIRLVDATDGHDIDARVEGFGQMKLKSSIVKKI